MTEQLTEEQRREILAAIPVGRFCEPEEVAHAVSFLISPLAGFITGEIIDQVSNNNVPKRLIADHSHAGRVQCKHMADSVHILRCLCARADCRTEACIWTEAKTTQIVRYNYVYI